MELYHSIQGVDKPQLFPILPFLCNEKSLLQGWKCEKKAMEHASIRIINDAEVASPVVTLESHVFDKTSIIFPDNKSKFIGTPYPFLNLQIKNMNKYIRLEIIISDESNNQKIFVCTNKQSLTRLIHNKCSLPLKLENGWNIIVIDLESLCKRVFNVKYKHCNSIQMFANCRVRKIYFSKDLYQEDEVPDEYKIYGMRNALLIHQQGIVQTGK
eukprot:879778_1